MRALVQYQDSEVELEGYLATPPTPQRCPGVLVVPTWLNVNESICSRAQRFAELGYAALVADIFGAGVRPGPPQSPMDVVLPFLSDRLLFRRRLLAALETLRRRPECEVQRVAAVGYCLGGTGVLELARAGVPLRGVVSLHGLLETPNPASPGGVVAKVLILHGDADPLVSFDHVGSFRREMCLAGANWEISMYGGARHSFTGEGASPSSGPEAGLHGQSERRSWRATAAFLAEVLG